MLQVLEVISDQNIGGAGRLLINRIKNTDRTQYHITVIIPKESMLLDLLKRENVNVIEINGAKNRSFDLKCFFKFLKIIKCLSPDIINCHASMSARLAAKMLGVRVKIFTRHCDFPIKSFLKIPILRVALGFFNNYISDGAIAVSYSAKHNLIDLGVSEKKIKVIINGSQPQRKFSKEENDAFKKKENIPQKMTIVGIFARLEKYKDHMTFINAAKVLENEKCFFIIVGTGNEENNLKNYVRSLGIDNKVRFVGFVEDVTPWLNITDINVNCSVGTETSSLALSEGMSIGVPAIVSDYAGNKYMVKDGENGMIFPQRNCFVLAKKIECLMNNKAFYNKLSANALKRFENELNAKNMTEKTENYYQEMYNKKTCKNTDL